MVSFARSIGAVFAVGLVGGGIALSLLPSASSDFRPEAHVAPAPPTPCKKQTWPMTDRHCQSWTAARAERTNAERGPPPVSVSTSLPVTPDSAVKVALRSTIAPQVMLPALTAEPLTSTSPLATPQTETVGEGVTEPAPPPPLRLTRSDTAALTEAQPAGTAAHTSSLVPGAAPRPRPRAELMRKKRPVGPVEGIAVTTTSSDGSRRTIVIRPTSQQDLYYYAARRDGMAHAR